MKSVISNKERMYLKSYLARGIPEIYIQDVEMSPHDLELFNSLRDKINSDFPLDYLLGKIDIDDWGITLEINQEILIPRPETIDWVKEMIQQEWIPKDQKIVEIGTGTGVISIALAKNGWNKMIATDISQAAIEVAAKNSLINQTESITFYQSDILDNPKIDDQISENSWSIVSNPPYVPTSDKQSKSYESIKNEPEIAIFSGEDGLDFIKKLHEQVSKMKNKPKSIILELDPRNIYSAAEIFNNLYKTSIVKDFNSFPRVLRAQIIDD